MINIPSTTQKAHVTQFMIDFLGPHGNHDTLHDYMQREPKYDTAFCSAWNIIDQGQEISVASSDGLLDLIDKVHAKALGHLPQYVFSEGEVRVVHGRSSRNSFGISKGPCSDEEGLCDLIKKIWNNEVPYMTLFAFEDDIAIRYTLRNHAFCKVDANMRTVTPIYLNIEKSSQVSLEGICRTMLELYHKGSLEHDLDRFSLEIALSPEQRTDIARVVFEEYFQKIDQSSSDDEKISVICSTLRDIEQLHLYNDGNGRTLYILANFLFFKNNLRPFYPTNICLFDANSIEKMVQEVKDGMERFQEMFGTREELSDTLRKYAAAISQLRQHISSRHPEQIKFAFSSRKFDLLLRLCATDIKYLSLLEALLERTNELGYNPSSPGKNSGNAMDIAQRNGNFAAQELLQRHGIVATSEN